MDEESTIGCGWRCRWPVMDEYSCRGRRTAVAAAVRKKPNPNLLSVV